MRPAEWSGWLKPIPNWPGRSLKGMPDLLAEAQLAIEFEQARSLADVLLRRTRLGLTAASSLATPESVEPLTAVMARGLGWGDIEKKRQVDEWLATMKAEGLNPAGDSFEAPEPPHS